MQEINIDFVVSLTKISRQHDSIWVIVNRLTKFSYFIPMKSIYKDEDHARLYIDEIVRLHGIILSIISDRRAQFTSQLWGSF